MSDVYFYRAMAEPCGCEETFMEKSSIPFEHLLIIGIREEPCDHGNDFHPIEPADLPPPNR